MICARHADRIAKIFKCMIMIELHNMSWCSANLAALMMSYIITWLNHKLQLVSSRNQLIFINIIYLYIRIFFHFVENSSRFSGNSSSFFSPPIVHIMSHFVHVVDVWVSWFVRRFWEFERALSMPWSRQVSVRQSSVCYSCSLDRLTNRVVIVV